MPPGAGRDGYSGAYTGISAYAQDISDQLREVIAGLGKDRFSAGELRSAMQEARKRFGEESDAFSALWQNGLLGYVERRNGEEVCVFYADRRDELRIPTDRDEYVFHSSMIDSVGVKSVGERPVY
jgi:hypothetical protein